jgi:Domain of unknown function (DUF5710)
MFSSPNKWDKRDRTGTKETFVSRDRGGAVRDKRDTLPKGSVPNVPLSLIPKIYLEVPYCDKDLAKALGCRWCPEARSWCITRPLTLEPYRQWCSGDQLAEYQTACLEPWEIRLLASGTVTDWIPRAFRDSHPKFKPMRVVSEFLKLSEADQRRCRLQ